MGTCKSLSIFLHLYWLCAFLYGSIFPTVHTILLISPLPLDSGISLLVSFFQLFFQLFFIILPEPFFLSWHCVCSSFIKSDSPLYSIPFVVLQNYFSCPLLASMVFKGPSLLTTKEQSQLRNVDSVMTSPSCCPSALSAT